MIRIACVLVVIFCCSLGFSQSNYNKFKNLSSPKKWWVIFHPFKAKKALLISKEANKVADSIKRTDALDKDHAGGQVDAFRHAYWMARLRQDIGKSAAKSLGESHEKENYEMYKKRKLEEGNIPDKISSDMDLYNNDIGLTLTRKGENVSRKKLVLRVINAIKSGKMKVIKKNLKKQFLNCKGEVISSKSLKGKWENSKCLVDSNYKRSF